MSKTGVSLVWIIYLLVCGGLSSGVYGSVQELEWRSMSRDISDSNLHTIAVDPGSVSTVYICSDSAVYRTLDGGKRWEEVFSLTGTGKAIHSISISPSRPNTVYAGSDSGLYRSTDRGDRWDEVFRGIGEAARAVLYAAVHPANEEIIYAGTRAGLFLSVNNGSDWEKIRGLPSDAVARYIVIHDAKPHTVYAVTDRGLYRGSDSRAEWKRILQADYDYPHEEMLSSGDIDSSDREEIETENEIRSIAIDPDDADRIYAATSRGLLASADEGSTWRAMSSVGLSSRNIRHVVMSESDTGFLYAVTERGVFRYSVFTDRWEELHKGLSSADVRSLAVSREQETGQDFLWAVTKRGIFQSLSAAHESARQQEFSGNDITLSEDSISLFAHEPSIGEIRQAAIEYAEVQPAKIREWRRAAANRAWLPDIRFAYDKGKDWQSSYTFYKIEEEYRKYDDVTKDRETGWSVSLTWELGDLIWNNAQTSIDSRSRLMVQLRDDVLNEVTRLYFERRRLQIDLLLSPLAEGKEGLDSELRLQELTAHIDSLTGSYLSKRLAQAGIRDHGQD